MRLVTHKWILAPHDSIPNVKMLLKIVWKKRRVLTPNHCPYFACLLFQPPEYYWFQLPLTISCQVIWGCQSTALISCLPVLDETKLDVFIFSFEKTSRFWTSLWALEGYVWKVHILVGLPVLFEVFTCIDWRKHIDTSSTCYIFVLHFR